MLIVSLALRDLWQDRFQLFCNCAMLVGVLVPLLVLFGVKNGVYAALIGEMRADPAYRQIDTTGNVTLTEGDIRPLRDWPELAFLTPKVRAQFDYVNVRVPGARVIRQAVLIPSGSGDPTLPPDAAVSGDRVAVSAQLARQLQLEPGSALQLITQAEGRPRQLLLEVAVDTVLPDRAIAGRAVLAPYETLDLVEAFYDAYALPDHGIDTGKDLSQRVPAYAGLRLYARQLEDLAALQLRVEEALGVTTRARTRDVGGLLRLGRNLNLALGLTAAIAAAGLAAALTLSFWSGVARKRRLLASLAMLGIPARQLALLPLVQALMAGVLGLIGSFALYAVAARGAQMLFGQGLPGGRALTEISMAQAAALVLAVLALVCAASALAAWRAQRADPARVLREVA